MDGSEDKPADATLPWNWSLRLMGLLGLVAWQTWLTLGLFGPDTPWHALVDDRPVVSGSHPQHLYLGTLGAQSLSSRGTICVYDSAFQAGYPKTPIFNGSRIAEIALFLGGGSYNPAAYKVGLLVICLLVPLLLLVACFGTGLSGSAGLTATATGIFLAWGPSGRPAVEAGEVDLLLASLGVLAHAGMLIRFHRVPGAVSWLGLWLTASLVWFSQPLVFPLALPLLIFFYLCVGVRHGSFTWHVALLLAQLGALAVNLPWLIDWVSYWWLRSPLPVSTGMLPHRTFGTLWNAPLWGGSADRFLAVVLLGSGLCGLALLHYQQRLAARLLGMGGIGLLVLAFLGISWEPIGQMGTSALFLPALWFAALPAAHAWTWVIGRLSAQGRKGRLTLACLGAGLGVAGVFGRDELAPLSQRCLGTEPLQIGLGPVRAAVVGKIVQHTGPEARILWEDRPLSRQASRWSALLPILTGRAFLGGLDPDAFIEHSSISFIDGALEGRSIATWSDEALEEYCKRYNVGWVIAWSPVVLKRFSDWEGTVPVTDLYDDVPGRLFLVKHAPRDFTLKGKAQLTHADGHHITLADVVPENGVVVLSLHYQAGMQASPSRVQIEREPSGHDLIGFIRLRLAGPAARVTLTWGN
jgi:hypothetical protein